MPPYPFIPSSNMLNPALMGMDFNKLTQSPTLDLPTGQQVNAPTLGYLSQLQANQPAPSSVTDFTQQFTTPTNDLIVDEAQAQTLPTDDTQLVDDPELTQELTNPQTDVTKTVMNPYFFNGFSPYQMFGAGNVPMQGTTPFYAQALGRSIAFDPNKLREAGVSERAVKGARGTNILRGIFSGLGTGLSTAKDVLAGMGQEKRRQFTAMRNAQKMRQMAVNGSYGGSEDLFNNAYLQYFGQGFGKGGQLKKMYKKGGEHRVPMEQLMSGRKVTGFAPEHEAVANSFVEDKEHIIYPDGVISEVEGDKHTKEPNTGEGMLLPDKTKVISNDVKIGSAHAKLFRKMGIKAKASDTYAKVMKMYNKESGMEELHKNQEGFYKKLEKNAEVEDTNTKGLNEEYISENIKELEDQKQELAQLQRTFADLVFRKQEERVAETGEREEDEQEQMEQMVAMEGDNLMFEHGGMVIEIPLQFRDGGVFTSGDHVDAFKMWAQAKGFKNMREATDAIQQFRTGGEKKKKYDTGGEFHSVDTDDKTGMITVIENEGDDPVTMSAIEFAKKYSAEEYAKQVSAGNITINLNPDYTDDLAVRQSATDFGYGTVSDKETLHKRMTELYQQFPSLVRDSFGITVTGGKVTGVANFDEDAIKKFQTGVFNTLNQNLQDAKNAGLPDEQIKQMEEFISRNNFLEDIPAGSSEADMIRGFDSKFGNFTSTRSNMVYPFLTTEDTAKTSKLGIRTIGDLSEAIREGMISEDDLSTFSLDRIQNMYGDDWKNYEGVGFLLGTTDPEITVPDIAPEEAKVTAKDFGNPPVGGARGAGSIPIINQDPLPPDPLASHFFNIPNLERITPHKVSPEEALVEGNRFGVQAFDMIQQAPGAQAGSNVANVIGQLSDSANKAVSDANRQNAQLASQARQVNVQQSNAEALAQDKALERFDKLSLTALDTHNTNVRNYYKKLQENRVNAQKEQLALKILDATSDQFAIDPFEGIVFTGGDSFPGFSNPLVLEALYKQTNNLTAKTDAKVTESTVV